MITIGQAEPHGLAHGGDVPGDPGDQVAGAGALDPTERQGSTVRTMYSRADASRS